jgi:type I restriction enzyme S subunit
MGVSMATSQDFVNWVCSEALLPEFLLLALMAEGDGIRRFGRGTTHTTIYYPEIKALYICIPPVEEQREIVEQVERSRSTIALLEDALAEAAHRTDALRFSILASAFTGKLVPQDPADESVFALPGISIDPFSSNDRRTNTTQARRIRAI